MLDAKLPPDLKSISDFLCQTVREAGALALGLAQQNVTKWNKPDGSLVTDADLQIDAFLKQRLQGAYPDYGWLSEETPDSEARLTCARLWIVDPIDGTTAFANGGNEWCIGVALIENGAPLLSVIYRPVVEEFYWAARGAGAFCNTARLATRDTVQLAGSEIMATGKAAKHFVAAGITASRTYMPLLMRLAFVASGNTDITMSFGNKYDWDLAAGDLLVQEAGGCISRLDGSAMVYNRPEPWQNGLVAAGRNKHRAVITELETL